MEQKGKECMEKRSALTARSRESRAMKLNLYQAPLYGDCVLTIHLDDDEVCCAEGTEEEEEVEFYLLFSGSNQRHLTTTLRVSHVTLQATCPAHDVCEQVLVTLCSARPDGTVDPHSQENFCYVQDLALDMAHLLLDNTTPQKALLLDDQQVPSKECERLDQSLTLALKHVSLLYQRTAVPSEPWIHMHTDLHITDMVTNTQTDVQQKTNIDTHADEQIDSQIVTHTDMQTDTATDTNTHIDIDRNSIEQVETHMNIWMDGSTRSENGIDLSRCQQQSTLLHFAASRGLRRVASFLLQQPGGKETLMKTDACGQTPASLAKTKGHQHLLELFTQYEMSLPDLRVEPEDQRYIYPGGRVFQHHPSLGTYTLTLPSHQEREGHQTDSTITCCIQEEVKELRRLIQLHRNKQGKSDLGGNITSAPSSPPLTSNHELSSPACGTWVYSNGQPESQEAPDLALATIENCFKASEEQGSAPLLEERTQGEDSAVVSHTSCTTGNLFHSQETGGEQEVTLVANSRAVRNRKGKRRAAKATTHVTKTLQKNKSTKEPVEGAAKKHAKTTGSTTRTEETVLPIEQTVVCGKRESAKNPSRAGTEMTALPIKPLSGPDCEGALADSRPVVLVTTTVEKQEGENWEVDLETFNREVERETLTTTKWADIKYHSPRQRSVETELDLASESVTERNVTMGQEQSQDPQDGQSYPAEPSQSDSRDQSPKLGSRSSPKFPGMESKPRRVLWRDGGWIGTGITSAPHGQEFSPSTIWYQDENSDQIPNEGTRIDLHGKEPVSQTVWYDNDTTDKAENGQLEHKKHGQSSPQASGLGTPQLFEQGLSFHQLSPALSQSHGTGIQPAASHGPGAQRQEVHRPQQEEEVGEEWKEGGVDRDGEEVENRQKANHGESGERAEKEEKPESEDRAEKGRKKRRKKRGKKGGTGAKLSSSSSVESQSQIEIQTEREKVTDQSTPQETERQLDSQAEAKTETGSADVHSPGASERVGRKEADKDTMRLPSQPEGAGRDSHGLDHDSITPNSCDNAPELSQIDQGRTEISQLTTLQTLEAMELTEDDCSGTAAEFCTTDLKKTEITRVTALLEKEILPDPAELVESNTAKPVQLGTPTDNVDFPPLSENEDFIYAVEAVAADLTGPVESNCIKELPLKSSDLTKSTKGLVEFPEHNTEHVESMNSSNPVQPVKHFRFMGKPTGFMESVQPTEDVGCIYLLQARSPLFEGMADGSPLKIQEGSTEKTTMECLQHSAEQERRTEETKRELREDEEEMGEEKGEAEKNEERQDTHSEEPETKSQTCERREEKEKEEEIGSRELSSTQIAEEERREEVRLSEEFPPADTQKEQKCTEELAATAVAVVTVAIASAIASIELNHWLADSQSKSKVSTQFASKDQAKNLSSAQDTKVLTETMNQLTECSYTQRSTQQISKDHDIGELLLEAHSDNIVPTELDTKLAAETENQPSEQSQIKPRTQFTSKEQASAELSKEADAVVLTQIDAQCKTDDSLLSERENQHTTQANDKEQANVDLSMHAKPVCLTQLHKEGIQPATTAGNEHSICSLHKKEDHPVQAVIKSLSEADEIIMTQVNTQCHTQTEIQLHRDSQIPCCVKDTGRCPETSDMSHSENPREHGSPHFLSEDRSICKKESVTQGESGRHWLESHSQENKLHETDDSHSSLSTAASQGALSGQTHARDSLDSPECETEGKESQEEGLGDMPDSGCQAMKCQGDPHQNSQGKRAHVDDVTCCDNRVVPSALPPCGPTPHATPCDSPVMVHSNPESKELTAPVSLENKASLLSQSLPDERLVATACVETYLCEDHPFIPMDNEDGLLHGPEKGLNAQDTVDGWKERERRNQWEEAKVDTTAARDRSQTEPETFSATAEQPRETKTDSDTTHSLEIQRERETFCPLQPCPEDTTPVTACTASHPDREECVSVCVLQRDTVFGDGVTASAESDDTVFKKFEEPVPEPEGRCREVSVSWSSADDSSLQGPLSASSLPSQDALLSGTSNTEGPWSCRDPWKSGTGEEGGEGGGGGGTEGGEEEEEKKDQLTENPVSSAILRASVSSLSPFRRHSWEPARNNTNTGETDMMQRSSFKSLSVEVKRSKPPLHRRSMSWCPSSLPRPNQEQIDNRSYSLEGLEVERRAGQATCLSQGVSDREERTIGRGVRLDSQERGGSLVSLTEEEQEGDASSVSSQSPHQVLSMTTSCPSMFHHQALTKSISMVAISQQETDETSSFSSTSGSVEYSILEDRPGPLRSDTEGRGGTKVSRTFSYLRSKMSKKSKEKDKERRGEKERESKEREKKMGNGHLFTPVGPSSSTTCQQCAKPLNTKDAFLCNNCGVHVHKSCKESLAACTKATMRQSLAPEAVPGSAVNTRSKSTSSASSVSSTSSSSSREQWSMLTSPEDQLTLAFPRRNPSILSFNTHSNLAKSISTSNISGLDDAPLKGLKFLSQSTDSLHQGSKVSASTESLIDEGTEMMDSQLMGEFECEVKDLEAVSWSATVDKKFLKTLKKDEIKRQDVIYELYQTEFHHVRTLRIMSEVYYKGIQKELQLDNHTLDKVFPMIDDLLETHTQFLTVLLERRRASLAEARSHDSFLIRNIGDVLVNQFSGFSAEQMKKVYGKFCSRHNEAVNLYKELHTKDKRFQAFMKRLMSNSIVRRLSIPECILLVTQRITKYPVLIQRILQHTKDSDEDHGYVSDALRHVKELITAVDSKVNEQEKKRRLREVYSRTDSKSIMRMKSGQMFAKEDLIRGRRLLHDGALQLKNSAGRLKDVHAMLLSDVLVFLQEKDQKYVFASLDQRSTVISLQKLIVREVANEERGLFLITAGIERPEMVEVLASTKDERNAWMAIIQDAMHCMEKDEDEGVPSETEEDRRQQETRAKEIRELLRRKDELIISLLEEKVHIFRDLCDCNSIPDDTNPPIREHLLFRAKTDDVAKGEPVMTEALREVETLHALVNSGLCGAACSTQVGLTGGAIGPVCLPRRAETFGGFDSHQMNSSKNGEKDEGDESLDLRRTESDSVLKKGATISLQMLLKRNNEQVLHSVTNLHDLLTSLKAVVVQQDSFIEDQRQALNDRLTTSRHSSSSSLSSSSSSRPSSLIEQEKQRSLERQRQEAASLQKQQVAYQEERRRREKEWDMRERGLAEREEKVKEEEEKAGKRHSELEAEREELHKRKEEYQRDLERLRETQRRLERDKEALRRDTERMEAMRREELGQLQRYERTPSSTSEDSLRFHSSGSLDFEPREGAEQSKEVELSSSAPTKEPFLRIGSKKMGKNFNPFSSSSSSSKSQGGEKESQLPTRLLQLTKPKEKKEKKKKGKGGEQTQKEGQVTSDPQNDGDIFFC